MRYRVLVSVEIDVANDRQAHECAVKLGDLLKEPFVAMTIQGAGIPLSGDGNLVVYQPLPASALRA
jgi:hypothetical protein